VEKMNFSKAIELLVEKNISIHLTYTNFYIDGKDRKFKCKDTNEIMENQNFDLKWIKTTYNDWEIYEKKPKKTCGNCGNSRPYYTNNRFCFCVAPVPICLSRFIEYAVKCDINDDKSNCKLWIPKTIKL
jgi:hypothetical protein